MSSRKRGKRTNTNIAMKKALFIIVTLSLLMNVATIANMGYGKIKNEEDEIITEKYISQTAPNCSLEISEKGTFSITERDSNKKDSYKIKGNWKSIGGNSLKFSSKEIGIFTGERNNNSIILEELW